MPEQFYDLTGCYDLHLHTGPDVIPRRLSSLELAQQAMRAGMRGFALKNHRFPTQEGASVLGTLYPQLDIAGSLVLNHEVGGINPAAVLAAAKMGIRMLWFPTIDAAAYRKGMAGAAPEGLHTGAADAADPEGLGILNADGSVSESTMQVLEIAGQYDLVVGTGHLGAAESLILIETAARAGLKHLWLTHVNLPTSRMEPDQIKYCIRLGAFVEYAYYPVLTGLCSVRDTAGQIRALGAEHVILTTDLGQINNPDPADGLLNFCRLLLEEGITEKELDQMLKKNPRTLLYGGEG